MARTTLGDALDRLAEAAAEVTELTGDGADRDAGTAAGTAAGRVSTALADVVVDLEAATCSSLGGAGSDPDVVLLRRLDRARRLLLESRAGLTGRPGSVQVC